MDNNEAEQWKSNFQRVVGQIITHMHERFVFLNQSYSYRKVLLNLLKEKGYTDEDAQDFIRLEMAEAYLQERQKHNNLSGV